MAVRFMKQCRCLLREATHVTPAVGPVGRLRLAGVTHKALTSATSPSSRILSSLTELLKKEPVFTPYPENQEMDYIIEKATNPEELLDLLGSNHELHCNHPALILIQISYLLSEKPEEKSLIIQDARFNQLLNMVSSRVNAVWHGTLVRLLRSLYALGLPRTSKELQSVEQEVRWRMRRFRYKHLVYLTEFCASAMRECYSQELLADLLLHLERRWIEISDSHTLLMLMIKAGCFSAALMDRLEDKCLELVEQFGPNELRRVLVILAAQSRRSVPLLRAISYHLVQKPFLLKKDMLLDLAYAYGKLNFHQTQVSQRLAADLMPLIPSLTAGEVAHCTKSFALLKWLNLPLFEAFTQHLLSKAQDVSLAHLGNMLLAFARLNFHPEQEHQFFNLVHERLIPGLGSLQPPLQVDLVWALCVLQQVQEAELQAVLHPGFHTQFVGSKSPKNQNTLQKLVHINTTALLEHPEYKGPLMPISTVALSPLASNKMTPLQKDLQDTLKALLGSTDLGSLEVATQYGWVLDAEVLLNADGQFLPLRNFVAPHLIQPVGSQPLPPGAKRIAFLRWEFPNFSSRSKDLLGRFVLARRHVQAAGFLVVDVPYYEWMELKSEWQKGAYLKDKMRKAMSEELAK